MTFRAEGLQSVDYVPADVLHDLIGHLRVAGVVEQDERQIRVGDFVAKHGTSNKIYGLRSTALAVQGVNMDTVITVDDANAFQAGENITVVGESEDTIVSVDYDLNQITLTAGLTNTRAVGVRCFNANDDLGTTVGIHSMGETIPGRAFEQTIAVAIHGHFLEDKLGNLHTQVTTDLGGTSDGFNVYTF